MELFLAALLIFCLRIVDVSIGTLRTLYMVRGDRLRAVPLAFCESLVWVVAISRIMGDLDSPWLLFAYAAGFATGTFTGITIERWIASGWILARIVGCGDDQNLVRAVREAGFGVTVVRAEGRAREQCIMFVVALRKRGRELLELVRKVDPDAFVTVESVQTALGGYLPQTTGAAALRK